MRQLSYVITHGSILTHLSREWLQEGAVVHPQWFEDMVGNILLGSSDTSATISPAARFSLNRRLPAQAGKCAPFSQPGNPATVLSADAYVAPLMLIFDPAEWVIS
jgi:hypothetical protein